MTINKKDTLQDMLKKSYEPMTYKELLKSLNVINDVLASGYFTGASYKDIWTAKGNIIDQMKIKELSVNMLKNKMTNQELVQYFESNNMIVKNKDGDISLKLFYKRCELLGYERLNDRTWKLKESM